MDAATLSHIVSQLLDGHTLPSAEQLEQLRSQYPFFTLPDSVILASDNDLTSQQISALKARIALNAPNASSLIKQLDPDGSILASFYPRQDSTATPSTDSAIDTFLDTYGNVDPREQALLERLIFNPVPADYAQLLERESSPDQPDPTSQPLSEQDAMLDAFLQSQSHKSDPSDQAPQPPANSHPIAPDPRSPLSESLAKLYIQQQRYDKAYEIIHQLSLNFPKKSIYFADQLRFLKKLIINQRAKNK